MSKGQKKKKNVSFGKAHVRVLLDYDQDDEQSSSLSDKIYHIDNDNNEQESRRSDLDTTNKDGEIQRNYQTIGRKRTVDKRATYENANTETTKKRVGKIKPILKKIPRDQKDPVLSFKDKTGEMREPRAAGDQRLSDETTRRSDATRLKSAGMRDRSVNTKQQNTVKSKRSVSEIRFPETTITSKRRSVSLETIREHTRSTKLNSTVIENISEPIEQRKHKDSLLVAKQLRNKDKSLETNNEQHAKHKQSLLTATHGRQRAEEHGQEGLSTEQLSKARRAKSLENMVRNVEGEGQKRKHKITQKNNEGTKATDSPIVKRNKTQPVSNVSICDRTKYATNDPKKQVGVVDDRPNNDVNKRLQMEQDIVKSLVKGMDNERWSGVKPLNALQIYNQVYDGVEGNWRETKESLARIGMVVDEDMLQKPSEFMAVMNLLLDLKTAEDLTVNGKKPVTGDWPINNRDRDLPGRRWSPNSNNDHNTAVLLKNNIKKETQRGMRRAYSEDLLRTTDMTYTGKNKAYSVEDVRKLTKQNKGFHSVIKRFWNRIKRSKANDSEVVTKKAPLTELEKEFKDGEDLVEKTEPAAVVTLKQGEAKLETCVHYHIESYQDLSATETDEKCRSTKLRDLARQHTDFEGSKDTIQDDTSSDENDQREKEEQGLSKVQTRSKQRKDVKHQKSTKEISHSGSAKVSIEITEVILVQEGNEVRILDENEEIGEIEEAIKIKEPLQEVIEVHEIPEIEYIVYIEEPCEPQESLEINEVGSVHTHNICLVEERKRQTTHVVENVENIEDNEGNVTNDLDSCKSVPTSEVLDNTLDLSTNQAFTRNRSFIENADTNQVTLSVDKAVQTKRQKKEHRSREPRKKYHAVKFTKVQTTVVQDSQEMTIMHLFCSLLTRIPGREFCVRDDFQYGY